jgi:hypothetical protein
MEYQSSVIELIRQRNSCRSFSGQAVDPEKTARLNLALDQINSDAADRGMRFQLIDRQTGNGQKPEKLGTYGMIAGAATYLIGIVTKSEDRIWQFGFLFEKVILFATDLGLATCWLGGSFNRIDFSRKVNLTEQEYIPIISPVGYAREKRTIVDQLVRMAASSSTRKAWSELFFQPDGITPLDRELAGSWSVPLEMVRLAPSASNKQPWRVFRDETGFSFFLARTRGYPALQFDMQMSDIGIAMCHFESAARELGLPGEWRCLETPDRPGLQYVMNWII